MSKDSKSTIHVKEQNSVTQNPNITSGLLQDSSHDIKNLNMSKQL